MANKLTENFLYIKVLLLYKDARLIDKIDKCIFMHSRKKKN